MEWNGKSRKQYSVVESERFDEFTGIQGESSWYKIDRETEPWRIWDGLAEMKFLMSLRTEEEDKAVEKIKEKLKAKFYERKAAEYQKNRRPQDPPEQDPPKHIIDQMEPFEE